MAITRVQGNKRGIAGNSSSLSMTLDSIPTEGNLLIAVIGTYGSYAPYVDYIDQGDYVHWTRQVESHNDSLYGRRVEIWAGAVGANASANLTIYLGNSGSGANADPVIADICEYSGLSNAGFLDKTTTHSGVYTRTLETGYTPTTTVSDELWVGGIFNVCNQGNGENSTSPTNNFTLLDGQGAQIGGQTKSLAYLEHIVSTTGIAWSGCYGGSYTTYEAYVGCMATFKPAVNNDYHLNDSSKWKVDLWGNGTHDPASNAQSNVGNSDAYAKYDATSQGYNIWGNTEYEQGYDPWGFWGSTWNIGTVLLSRPNQKISYRAKLDTNELGGAGVANAYINLWIMFQDPDHGGPEWGYGEIEIFLHKTNDSTPDQTPFAETRYDSTIGNWYFVGYHATNLSADYTEGTVDLTPIINKFYDQWGIDLSSGGITGITFGVECERAKMKAIFDYVTYDAPAYE
jgi:hypothetical protein